MAIYNPHLPSHKLCRILDAGLATVEDIAQLSGESVAFVELVARNSGVKLSVDQRFNLGKALAPYFQKYPELYKEAKPSSKRGVEEVVLRARDWRGFEVTDASGRCIMYVEWPKTSVTQSRVDALWRWLDKEDPLPQLHAI